MQNFLPRLLLLICLSLPLQGFAQKTKLIVNLSSAIPEQLFLERQTTDGWAAIDSTWPSDDGLYYLYIDKFQPSLYQLRLAHLGTLPLLLTQRKREVRICMRGPDFIAASTVDNLAAASCYIHAMHLLEQANYWSFLATQASKIETASPASLSLIDSLARCAKQHLNDHIDSAISASPDTLLQHFLFLSKRPTSNSTEAWWPNALLQDSLIALSNALRLHLQDFFYAQIRDSYSRPQLDSAFANALRSLALLPMHPSVAQRLRAYTLLFFTDAHYRAVANLAMLNPFGPLSPSPLLALAPTKQLAPAEALHTKVNSLHGKAMPLINATTRYTLLIVWSVWCPHCQALLPKIHQWWCSLPKGLLDVIAVSIDRPNNALNAHINLKNWKWRNAVVEEDNDNSHLLENIGFEGTPQLVLFDANGNTITQPQTLAQLQNQF